MNPIKRVPLGLTAGVALVAVIGSVALAKATAGARGAPELATPFAFLVLFLAAITLLAVAVVSSQRLVDEMDAAHPFKVRNRGALFRLVKRVCRRLFALAGRVSRAWLRWLSAAIAVLWRELQRFSRWALRLAQRASRASVRWLSAARVVLRRELTHDALERRGRAVAIALSGVPPDDIAPPPDAEPSARPERPEAGHTLPRSRHHAPPRSGLPRNQALSALARLADQARRHEERART